MPGELSDAGPPVVKPPVFRSAVQAYVDFRAAMTAMPDMLLVGLIVSFAFTGLEIAFGVPSHAKDGVLVLLMWLILNLAWDFFFTPVLIAIHRYIVLGEITPRYHLTPWEPRFLSFFGWTALLSVFATLSKLPFALSGSSRVGWTGVAIALALLIILVRSILLLPAIAVDATEANWRNAWSDSHGHFWRIFGIFMLTMLPLIGLDLLLAVLLGAESRIHLVISGVTGVVGLALGVAVASRLYQALARRLRGMPAA